MPRLIRMRVSPQVGSVTFGALQAPAGAVLLEGELHDDVDPQRLRALLAQGLVTLEVVQEELAAASPEGRRGRGRSSAAGLPVERAERRGGGQRELQDHHL